MAGLFATAGAKLYIGGTLAAKTTDFVLADYSGQSWNPISWIESLGALGDSAAEITFDAIDAERTQKLKGVRNAGNMEVVIGLDYEDYGQSALRAAEADDASYAFKLEFDDEPSGGSPSERYFIAKVMSASEQLDTANNVARMNVTLAIDSNIVRVTAS